MESDFLNDFIKMCEDTRNSDAAIGQHRMRMVRVIHAMKGMMELMSDYLVCPMITNASPQREDLRAINDKMTDALAAARKCLGE